MVGHVSWSISRPSLSLVCPGSWYRSRRAEQIKKGILHMSLQARTWPVKASGKYATKLKLLQEGRRLFEQSKEKDREDMIRHFNKLAMQKHKTGLSQKKILTFISGVSGRAGEAEDWERHWWKSVRRYRQKLRQRGDDDSGVDSDVPRHVERECAADKSTLRPLETPWREVVVEDRRELSFDERVRRVLEDISGKVRRVEAGQTEVLHCGEYADEVVDDFRCRIARWEGCPTTDVERVREVVELAGSQCLGKRWLALLDASAAATAADLVDVVEGVIHRSDSCVVADETLLEKTVLRCLASPGLEAVGVALFRLAVVCGEHRRKPLQAQSTTEPRARDDRYGLAEGVLRLHKTITSAEPLLGNSNKHHKSAVVVFPFFRGAQAVRVGVRVCAALRGLRDGELMLWASRVVVAHSEPAGSR